MVKKEKIINHIKQVIESKKLDDLRKSDKK